MDKGSEQVYHDSSTGENKERGGGDEPVTLMPRKRKRKKKRKVVKTWTLALKQLGNRMRMVKVINKWILTLRIGRTQRN